MPRLSVSWSEVKLAGFGPRRPSESSTMELNRPSPTSVFPVNAELLQLNVTGLFTWSRSPLPFRLAVMLIGPLAARTTASAELTVTFPASVQVPEPAWTSSQSPLRSRSLTVMVLLDAPFHTRPPPLQVNLWPP